MSPVPVTAFSQLTGALADPAYVYTTLVASVNGIQNPDFLFAAEEPDPRFERFVSIMTTLTRAKRLHWVENPRDKGGFSIIINHYAPTYAAEVERTAESVGAARASRWFFSGDCAGVSGAGWARLRRHWTYHALGLLSGGTAVSRDRVPQEDQRNGVTASYPAPGLAGKELRVLPQQGQTGGCTVTVNYRDGWFYIDENDQATKRFFRLLGTLWSVTIAESAAKGSAAPLLTVPVSR